MAVTFPFTDQMLVERWPAIPWTEPLKVNGVHFACRLCIARYGLKGHSVIDLPTDATEVREHILACHPTVELVP